jgi:cob(I)alamin adenosyltransferase
MVPEEMKSTGEKAGKHGRGLVIVYTGTGKGKTTAALGMMLRAWGRDMKVVMLQFMKSTNSNYGEHRAARRLGVEIVALGAGFTWHTEVPDKGRSLAIELWERARGKIASGDYHMVVLDEFSYPIQYGWVQVKVVLQTLKERPSWVHVVITGRDMPSELIDFADIVTDMAEVKHAFTKGIKAQPGIEF